MARRYVWPRCTEPDCGHQRTWKTEPQATAAFLRHPDWTTGSQAICLCHGAERATFPCDEAEANTHHA